MKFAVIAVMLVAMSGLVGCNTAAGLGKDIERAGEKIQGAVTKD